MSNPITGHAHQTIAGFFGDVTPTRWVTRERPKIDRIACPWLIRRFIDPDAEFFYAPADQVFDVARARNAIAFDLPGAPFSHIGERCSFDAFVERLEIVDAGVEALAPIIRGADTGRHDLAPQSAGLHALSLGLSLTHEDDRALLQQGMVIYDALHAWATKARGEKHNWTPA